MIKVNREMKKYQRIYLVNNKNWKQKKYIQSSKEYTMQQQ